MRRTDLLRQRLESLEPLHVRITDESSNHAGHVGVQSGGESHFHVEIVSRQFAGLSRVARHRLIYAALGSVFDEGLHALRIDARAPEE